LASAIGRHRRSQERGHPTPAQASEEGEAGAQLLQPVAQKLQRVEEMSQDDTDTDTGDELLTTTTGGTDRDLRSGITTSSARVAEKRGEHKTERVPLEAEEGTSSHLARVNIISYSQL
jgi:hypothetical protein